MLALLALLPAAEDVPPPPSLTVADRLLAGGTARAAAQCVMYPADALRTLAQTRGGAGSLRSSSLLSGAGTTSAFAYGIGALQFAVFGTVAPLAGPLAASVCGAAASCLCSVPQEVLKQRLVTGIYPSFGEAVRRIWTAQGPSGFYAGWLPTVSRNVPFVAATFTAFAALEARALRASGEERLRPSESVAIGT